MKWRNLRLASAIALLVFGIGVTGLHSEYTRLYYFQREYADKLLQIGFLKAKKNQVLDHGWMERKKLEIQNKEVSLLKTSFGSIWFIITAFAAIFIPGFLVIYLFRSEKPLGD